MNWMEWKRIDLLDWGAIVEKRAGSVGMNKQMQYLADCASRQRVTWYVCRAPGDIPSNQIQPTRRLYQVQQLGLYQSNPVRNPVLRPSDPFLDPVRPMSTVVPLQVHYHDQVQLDELVPLPALVRALAAVLLLRAILDSEVRPRHRLLGRYCLEGRSLVQG